ncbi:MAG: hypothetical protein A2X78_02910 [Gammaproteobacteria bacterium GWE2_37_16]|nr:MAG: hypothetical protein A2X78_02910 [Gammaproteobacteria bacterium GWE2_37_16]
MTFDIFHNSLQPIIQFLHTHPHYSGLMTFFVVFCEAMAVIGVIVPGTVTMTAIGVLIGSGVIPAVSTFIWAICGGIVGDYLSYIIGVYYKDRLHRMWPFKKYPQLLERGEKFFAQHGGKSIIIGRFFGPMRAMIPMVAGMLKMSIGRFLLAAIPSVTIWAILYILPGTLLGALALELPPKVATQFLLWAMLCVIIIWSLIWLAQHFLKRLCSFFDRYILKLWIYLNKSPHFNWLTKFLADPRKPDNHQQLTLLIATLITALIFLYVLTGVITQNAITIFNQPLYHLLHSIRTETGDKIMLFFTMLAEPKAILFAEIVFACWLAWKNYWYTFFHAVAIFVLCYASAGGIKLLAHVPRPNGLILSYSKDFSFPSFHTCAGVALYGFVAMIISRELKTLRWIPYTIAAVITTSIILSRLYLGAHWLTDVVGAIFLSLTLLFPVTISYRRRHPQKIPPIKTAIAVACIFGGILAISGLRNFDYQLPNYSPYSPIKVIQFKAWHSQTNNYSIAEIPLYRTDRLGHPINAFNVQWLGDINNIEHLLAQQGWQNYPAHFNIKEILRRLTTIHDTTQHVPILTQLYDNRPEALLMTKKLDNGKPQLLLRLWNANIVFNDSPTQFWIGVIDYYQPPEKLINFKNHSHKPKKFIGAVSELTPYLDGFNWRKIVYQSDKQPEIMKKLGWNGELLVIE